MVSALLLWFTSHRGQALRRGDDFAQFVRDAELPAYWELFGWPDACRPDDELEFVCE